MYFSVTLGCPEVGRSGFVDDSEHPGLRPILLRREVILNVRLPSPRSQP